MIELTLRKFPVEQGKLRKSHLQVRGIPNQIIQLKHLHVIPSKEFD